MDGRDNRSPADQAVSHQRLGPMQMVSAIHGAAARMHRLHELAGPVIERAVAVSDAVGGTGRLEDIEHFVLLMNENRSFDHYFGTLSAVAGFDDASSAFEQSGYSPGPPPGTYLNPFHLDGARGATLHGDVVNDPNHSWAVQHASWNGGAMDAFVTAHLASDGNANGPAVMGYYTGADLPVHRALADAFTLCDHYFCSVLGPTDPNRLFWMTGTLDPDGWAGGPLLHTKQPLERFAFSWKTYPECLEEAGIGWKIYQDRSLDIISTLFLSGMMDRFTAYDNDTPLGRRLCARALRPTFPNDFRADVAAGSLPAVSWIIPSVWNCEHPSLPPSLGALGILEVLDVLTSNPAIWAKTALIVSYDENGGFFDHVPPPTPGKAQEPGEYVTVDPLTSATDSAGIAGPIGLGFRVPALIMSPYTRGGLVASETFDHTSQLRLLERRFDVPIPAYDPDARVPGLSPWRRRTVGDLTSAFDFGTPPPGSPPPVPVSPPGVIGEAIRDCILILEGTLGHRPPYPVPPNSMPRQESGPPRRHPTGPVPADAHD